MAKYFHEKYALLELVVLAPIPIIHPFNSIYAQLSHRYNILHNWFLYKFIDSENYCYWRKRKGPSNAVIKFAILVLREI